MKLVNHGVDLGTLTHLLGVEIQQDKGDVGGELDLTGIPNVLGEPLEDGLERDLVTAFEGSTQS